MKMMAGSVDEGEFVGGQEGLCQKGPGVERLGGWACEIALRIEPFAGGRLVPDFDFPFERVMAVGAEAIGYEIDRLSGADFETVGFGFALRIVREPLAKRQGHFRGW